MKENYKILTAAETALKEQKLNENKWIVWCSLIILNFYVCRVIFFTETSFLICLRINRSMFLWPSCCPNVYTNKEPFLLKGYKWKLQYILYHRYNSYSSLKPNLTYLTHYKLLHESYLWYNIIWKPVGVEQLGNII